MMSSRCTTAGKEIEKNPALRTDDYLAVIFTQYHVNGLVLRRGVRLAAGYMPPLINGGITSCEIIWTGPVDLVVTGNDIPSRRISSWCLPVCGFEYIAILKFTIGVCINNESPD